MEKISDQIMKKIEEEKIAPTPRWHFLLKNYVFWSAFGLSVVLGGLAFGTILFFLLDNDWDIYKYLGRSWSEHLLVSLPYLWIFFLAIFLFLAYYNWKHTKIGYRNSFFLIWLSSISASIILGVAVFLLGWGNSIDRIFADNVPYYHGWHEQRMRVWNNPENGLLGGKILSLRDKNNFVLEDFQGKKWNVFGEEINWRGRVVPRNGEEIKIIGKQRGGSSFFCNEVRPWDGRGMMMKMRDRNEFGR